MAPTTARKFESQKFEIGADQARFVEQLVQSGQYATADEAVRAALRLLEEHEAKIAELRAAIAVADESVAAGRVIEVNDTQAFADDIIRRGRERLVQRS